MKIYDIKPPKVKKPFRVNSRRYSRPFASITLILSLFLQIITGIFFLLPIQEAQADPGWLSGWDKRVQVVASNTNVDSDITHFPLLLTLGTSVGTGNDDISFVFDELQSDANRKKIAVTKDDGETQLYVEIEKWDDANEEAILWVSKSDWTVSSTTDTELYLYYDKDHADNTTYVADAGSRTEVWESNAKGTWHLSQTTTSTAAYILDSTSNANNGSSTGTSYPTPTSTAQIDGGQSFDGADDYVNCGAGASLTIGDNSFTVVAWVKPATIAAGTREIYTKYGSNTQNTFQFKQTADDLYIYVRDGSGNAVYDTIYDVLMVGEWYQVVGIWNATTEYVEIYVNGVFKGSEHASVGIGTVDNSGQIAAIGRLGHYDSEYFNGSIDEVRIYNRALSAEEIKAHYYNESDGLVNWGSEEEVPGVEMSSSSYRIRESSINVGGMESQTSTSYKLRETIGEIVTGISTSTSYKLQAGYQEMQEVYIALSAPSSVAMSPSIGGLSGGQSNGSSSITVTTDSPSGYSLNIRADSSPAMATSSSSFTDYTPAGSDPDFNWSVLATTSEFGFTPEGSDIVQKFKDNGSSACNTGSNETTNACWYNFSTSNETISQKYSSNHPSGTATTVKFRAESGTQNIQAPGTYEATIVVTAITN